MEIGAKLYIRPKLELEWVLMIQTFRPKFSSFAAKFRELPIIRFNFFLNSSIFHLKAQNLTNSFIKNTNTLNQNERFRVNVGIEIQTNGKNDI